MSPFQSVEHPPLTGKKRLQPPLNGGQEVLRVRGGGGGGNGGQGGDGGRGALDDVGGSVPQNYIHLSVYFLLRAYPQIVLRTPLTQDHVNGGGYEGQIMRGE